MEQKKNPKNEEPPWRDPSVPGLAAADAARSIAGVRRMHRRELISGNVNPVDGVVAVKLEPEALVDLAEPRTVRFTVETQKPSTLRGGGLNSVPKQCRRDLSSCSTSAHGQAMEVDCFARCGGWPEERIGVREPHGSQSHFARPSQQERARLTVWGDLIDSNLVRRPQWLTVLADPFSGLQEYLRDDHCFLRNRCPDLEFHGAFRNGPHLPTANPTTGPGACVAIRVSS